MDQKLEIEWNPDHFYPDVESMISFFPAANTFNVAMSGFGRVTLLVAKEQDQNEVQRIETLFHDLKLLNHPNVARPFVLIQTLYGDFEEAEYGIRCGRYRQLFLERWNWAKNYTILVRPHEGRGTFSNLCDLKSYTFLSEGFKVWFIFELAQVLQYLNSQYVVVGDISRWAVEISKDFNPLLTNVLFLGKKDFLTKKGFLKNTYLFMTICFWFLKIEIHKNVWHTDDFNEKDFVSAKYCEQKMKDLPRPWIDNQFMALLVSLLREECTFEEIINYLQPKVDPRPQKPVANFIQKFLKSQNLMHYLETFIKNGFNFADDLSHLTLDKLVDMKIHESYHASIFQKIAEMNSHLPPKYFNLVEQPRQRQEKYRRVELKRGIFQCFPRKEIEHYENARWYQPKDGAVPYNHQLCVHSPTQTLMRIEFWECGFEFKKRLALMKNIQSWNYPYLETLFGYTVGIFENTIAILSEYAEHRSLRTVMALPTPLPWSFRLSIAHDAAQALVFLHDKKEALGHFTVDTILVDQNWKGFLSQTWRKFVHDEEYETRGALVPEDFLEEKTDNRYPLPEIYNLPHDIYQFGIFLNYLASKCYLFANMYLTSASRYMLRKQNPLRPLYLCPPGFEELVLQCLSHDPEMRPTAKQILSRLENLDPHFFKEL